MAPHFQNLRGRTRVFETHAVAAEQLCGRQVGPNDATEMVKCAAEAGSLDSFQFQYDWDVPENIEIVAVNLEGVYPCGTAASGRVAAFRSGWMASRPCDCDNAAHDGFLNCNLKKNSCPRKRYRKFHQLQYLPLGSSHVFCDGSLGSIGGFRSPQNPRQADHRRSTASWPAGRTFYR